MPVGWGIGRSQAIFDLADFPSGLTPGRVLTMIAYRRTVYPTEIGSTYAAKSLRAEVSVGNSSLAGNAIVATYASNRPSDVSVVLPLGSINFPSSPPIGAFQEVGVDVLVFPFATPKTFTGPHLFIEHVNSASAMGTVYWSDALDNRAFLSGGHNTLRGEFGCGTSVPTPTRLRAPTATSGNVLGSSTTYMLLAATPSTTFLHTIGFGLDWPYGLPAPLDLAAIGAPMCPLWNTLDIVSIGTTTATGSGSLTVSWPTDRSISGLEVGMQALVASPGFNAAGLTTSNGVSAWIGSRYPLKSSVVGGASTTAITGTTYVGMVPIVHLFWL